MTFSRASLLRALALSLIAVLLAAVVAACGDDDATPADDGAAIETETAVVEVPPTETTIPPTEAPTLAPPTATATPTNVPPTRAPTSKPATAVPVSNDWIDVDVTNYVVKLMRGSQVVQSIGPVAVGEQVDTGIYNSTATGTFYVYSFNKDLAFDAPYNTYISDWVGFDPALDNGFHSFLKDKDGKVVDSSTGRVSNGCIRTGDPEAIYNFAEIGMKVVVHT
jgi:hypothetical protein